MFHVYRHLFQFLILNLHGYYFELFNKLIILWYSIIIILYIYTYNFYENKETFKIFSLQSLEVYGILLAETTLESIMFYYTFSVINTMFVPCTALLYDSAAATRTLKLSTILLSISCGISLISLLVMSSLGITSHGTDSFRVKLITPGHPIPKISTHLTIFWGGTWKTEFVKTIHRQEKASSKKRSDGFHKKCSIELWTILMFELLLCCHTAARCMERT